MSGGDEAAGGGLTVGDRLEIGDLLARYNWAVDTDDAPAFVSTFTSDGRFVSPSGVFTGHAELTAMVGDLRVRRAHNQRSLFHVVSNVVLEGDGDQVRLVAQLIGPRLSAAGVHTLQLGWYDDLLVRTTTGWRFARRHYRSWADAAPSAAPFAPLPAGLPECL